MTLLDAPVFDEVHDREARERTWVFEVTVVLVLVVAWLWAGRPIDWPWFWHTHLRGRMMVDHFLADVEKGNLQQAYALWVNDDAWQAHSKRFAEHPFEKFRKEWESPGRKTVNLFFAALEGNHLAVAYGIRIHNQDWQRQKEELPGYSFKDFEQQWRSEKTGPREEFFNAIEADDLPGAYGVWVHALDWQKRHIEDPAYPFAQFQVDWSLHSKIGAVNPFFQAIEHDELATAYGIRMGDSEWQAHFSREWQYPFERFVQDWGPNGSNNEYGAIRQHTIVAARRYGNVLLTGVRINGVKGKTVFLNYEPRTGTLAFSPVELYLGP